MATYDPTTNPGLVRLLISDVDTTNPTFEDSEITAFLGLAADNVRLAAAYALDTIASNEVLVQKRIKLLDLTTDGPACAKELRAHAKALRDQVDQDLDDNADFDIAEMVVDDFSYREHIGNEFLRGL